MNTPGAQIMQLFAQLWQDRQLRQDTAAAAAAIMRPYTTGPARQRISTAVQQDSLKAALQASYRLGTARGSQAWERLQRVYGQFEPDQLPRVRSTYRRAPLQVVSFCFTQLGGVEYRPSPQAAQRLQLLKALEQPVDAAAQHQLRALLAPPLPSGTELGLLRACLVHALIWEDKEPAQHTARFAARLSLCCSVDPQSSCQLETQFAANTTAYQQQAAAALDSDSAFWAWGRFFMQCLS